MSDNIKVVVKVRPLISREIDDNLPRQWRVRNNTLHHIEPSGKDGQCFTFDKVYDEGANTSEVYNDIAKPIVESAVAGINGTIFAYGQTSSGKTYTMAGTPEAPGIIPLSVRDLFKLIKNKEDRAFLLRVSYIEIYNDNLKDLLDVNNDNVRIRESLQGIKTDATEKLVSNYDEVVAVMREGEENRQIGATNMNEKSSRSHTIFQITIESREHAEADDDSGSVNVSQLNLVDLAGSERAGQTGATGRRFIEGTHINKSLTTLALVIKQLSEDTNFINYRDSKLTRILQNSLGGNAKTSIICAVTPATVDETISTLQFANRAKKIKNKPEVNAVATSATMIQQLTKQLSALQMELLNKKDLEKDNRILTEKINKLKKQLINGFCNSSTRDFDVNRRKTWCAPRRVTIGAMPAIREDEALAGVFVTPGVKLSSLKMPNSDLKSSVRDVKMSRVSEESDNGSFTTPLNKKNVNFDSEVIEIGSDDDVSVTELCSPIHSCYESKTPPCVLRDKAKRAEKNYKEIVELAELEKQYPPPVNDLLEKLEQSTDVIRKMEDQLVESNSKCQEKDKEIESLKAKVTESNQVVENLNTEKSKLESTCEEYKMKLTDLEVSLETLERKAKSREEDLLSLLEEQRQLASRRKGKPLDVKLGCKDAFSFMDMSKDISLVNSDNESDDQPIVQLHETITSHIQSDLDNKNKLIAALEDEITTFKNKIVILEQSNKTNFEELTDFKIKVNNLKAANTVLMNTNETFESIIKTHEENLASANKSILSYSTLVDELNTKLKDTDQSNNAIRIEMFESMLSTEEMIITNNNEINTVLDTLKRALETRNNKISSLKSQLNDNSEAEAIKTQLEEKLKDMANITKDNNDFKAENERLTLALQNLNEKYIELQNSQDQLGIQVEKLMLSSNNLEKTNAELIDKNEVLRQEHSDKDIMIKDLEISINLKSGEITHLQNRIGSCKAALNDIANRICNQFLFNREGDENFENMVDLIGSYFLDCRNQLSLLQDKHEALTFKYLETVTEQNDVKQRYHDMQSKYHENVLQIKEISAQIKKKTRQYDELKSHCDTLEKKLQQHKTTKNSYCDKESGLLSKIENLEHQLLELKEQNKLLDQNLTEQHARVQNPDANESIQNKESSISKLNDRITEMENSLKFAEETKLSLLHQVNEQKEHLQCVLDNILNVVTSHNIKTGSDLDENMQQNIPLLVNAIENHICTINNDKKLSEDLELELVIKNNKIKDLENDYSVLQNEVKYYRDKCDLYVDKINSIHIDNEKLSEMLVDCNDSIIQLTSDVKEKVNALDEMGTKAKDLKSCVVSLEDSLVKLNNIPESLLKICCNKISEVMINASPNNTLTPTSSQLNVSVDDAETQIKCLDCNTLTLKEQTYKQRITDLENQLIFFKMANKNLLEEQESIRNEITELIEPSNELQRKLATHKTHLITLTATTYAETQLLKSQAQYLEHHLKRFQYLCQRDIPEYKKQLQDLLDILKSDSLYRETHSSILKRYSLPTCLNISNELLRNESTLDGDLLMLDTNVTLTTSTDTLTYLDQTSLDTTRAYLENLEIPSQIDQNTSVIEVAKSFYEDSTKSQAVHCVNGTKNSEMNTSQQVLDNSDATIDLNNVIDNKYCVTCETNKDIVTNHENILVELDELKAAKLQLEQKVNNLLQETAAVENQKRKIETLSKEIIDLNAKLKHVQSENDQLSNEVFENITEADDLKKVCDNLKRENIELMEKCEKLDALIKSTEREENTDLDISRRDSESKFSSKFYTLQNELRASREDCRKINEEVSTAKSQLERSNLTMSQAMDVDDSMNESNIFPYTKDLESSQPLSSKANTLQNQLEDNCIDIYSLDKVDCFNYYIEKTGDNKENFDREVKIVDVMKLLYNNIITQHSNEVQNLSKKLKIFEDNRKQTESEINVVKSKYLTVSQELENGVQLVANVNENTQEIIAYITSAICDSDTNMKLVTTFKENILNRIDSQFKLNTAKLFETLINQIAIKHQKDLGNIEDKYTQLQAHMETVAAELNAVNENVKQMQAQLNDKEREYNLLQSQKEKMQEINNAVTIDVIRREQSLNDMIMQAYQKLIEHDIINADEFNFDSSLTNNINKLLETLINQTKSLSQTTSDKESILKSLQENISKLTNENKQLVDVLNVQKQVHKKVSNENITKDQIIDELQKQIVICYRKLQSEITETNENNKAVQVTNIIDNIEQYKSEIADLKTINECIAKEKDAIATELTKAAEVIKSNKLELDNMTKYVTTLNESVKEKQKLIEDLNIECKSLLKINYNLKQENGILASKLNELQMEYDKSYQILDRLKLNIKTHEKTAEIQTNMINRLQKLKEENLKTIYDKEGEIEVLNQAYAQLSSQFELLESDYRITRGNFTKLQNIKEDLERRLAALEADLSGSHKGRQSLENSTRNARRLRQSIIDSKRGVSDDVTDDHSSLDGGFTSRSKPEDLHNLHMDLDDVASNRSASTERRDSLVEKPRSRANSLLATRRRRQSEYDVRRDTLSHTPDKMMLGQVQSETNIFKSSDSTDKDLALLKELLQLSQHELEELRERYKELDEECEMCAACVRERDDVISRLRREKDEAEKALQETKPAEDTSPGDPRFVDAAVNTHEDWAHLHSVVVDRMSFDAEVDKNKKLTRAIEDFRLKNRELKSTIVKMQRAMEINEGNNESALTRQLTATKQELMELRERYKEMDQEYDTCAEYLREREQQCLKLKEAKDALEARLRELEGDAKDITKSSRKKRQSIHDQNRSARPTLVDATTETSDGKDIHQYHVERDNSSKYAEQGLAFLNKKLESMAQEKSMLEQQVVYLSAQAQNPRVMYVGTGSAIVQNSQITDVMKENQKLKRQNAKLVSLCKKRSGAKQAEDAKNDPAELG